MVDVTLRWRPPRRGRHPSRVIEQLQQLRQQVEVALASAHPLWVFVGMVLLPLGPFPASVLFILAGNRFGSWGGFTIGLLALAANMSLGYWLARHLLRGPLERWLKRQGRQVPTFDPANELRFLLVFRITPGMPLFLQNYVLGLAGVRFARYLAVSLAAQAPYVFAFTWFGESLTKSSSWRIAVGVVGLLAVIVATNLIRRLLATTRQKPDEAKG